MAKQKKISEQQFPVAYSDTMSEPYNLNQVRNKMIKVTERGGEGKVEPS